jgi:hypothetical protein
MVYLCYFEKKVSIGMVIHSTNINKTNKHLSSQLNSLKRGELKCSGDVSSSCYIDDVLSIRKVWRYQRSKSKDTQYKRKNDLQNNTQKTKDRSTRTPLIIEDELRCSGRISSSCSTCGTRHVTQQYWNKIGNWYIYTPHSTAAGCCIHMDSWQLKTWNRLFSPRLPVG